MTYTAPRAAVRRRRTLAAAALLLAAAAVLLLLSRRVPGFAEWYARRVYPLFPNTVGRLFSPLPFSVFELLLYALGVLAALVFVRLFLLLFTARERLGAWAADTLARTICLLAALALLFTLSAGVAYSRAPLASLLGLDVRPRAEGELLALCLRLADDAAREAEAIPAEGGLLTLADVPVAAAAREAMRGLGARLPSLGGWYPRPKAPLASRAMSYLDITGIYSPFTLEANYNRDVPDYGIPFSVCHELAHLKGFMREDEANFLAYLACRDSDEAAFRYSGAAEALNYALNALARTGDADAYAAAWAAVPEAVRAEYAAAGAYWRQFEGPVAEASNRVNDSYLKANAQAAGTASYGRMVDLLLAEYAGA